MNKLQTVAWDRVPITLSFAEQLKMTETSGFSGSQGRTVRSPIDVLLASYCMTHGHTLLHRDADFESLKTLGGLDTWPQ